MNETFDDDPYKPSEEFRALAAVLLNDTKRSRNILLIAILGPFMAVGLTLGSLVIQVRTNSHIAKDSKATADFVRDCFYGRTARCPLPTTTTTVP